MWPAVGAAVGKAGMEIGASAIQNAMNKNMQQRAMRFAKKMYQHRWQYTVDDMRKAGINPIYLAMGKGGAGAAPTAGMIGAQKPQAPDLAQTASAVAQMRLTDAQADKARAEADAIKKFGLGATTWYGRAADSAAKVTPVIRDALIEIYDFLEKKWSAKGGPQVRRGKTYKYRLPPDTGRSGYEQRLHRLN